MSGWRTGSGKNCYCRRSGPENCVRNGSGYCKEERVVVLDLSGMVAGSKYRGEFEERIKNVVNEVREDRGILLFIDELHTIIGAGGAEGARMHLIS